MVNQGENNLKKFREDCRSRAAKIGHTLEEECDIAEKYTGCKEYADAMRELLGVMKDKNSNDSAEQVKATLAREVMDLTEEECAELLQILKPCSL